jgi:hypothetical protein
MIPEWGGSVVITPWSGVDRDEFDQELTRRRNAVNGRLDTRGLKAWLAVRSCYDEKGNRIFGPEDAIWLNTKSGAALERIWDAVRDLNRIGEEALQEDVKNSDAAQSDGSGSLLPQD